MNPDVGYVYTDETARSREEILVSMGTIAVSLIIYLSSLTQTAFTSGGSYPSPTSGVGALVGGPLQLWILPSHPELIGTISWFANVLILLSWGLGGVGWYRGGSALAILAFADGGVCLAGFRYGAYNSSVGFNAVPVNDLGLGYMLWMASFVVSLVGFIGAMFFKRRPSTYA